MIGSVIREAATEDQAWALVIREYVPKLRRQAMFGRLKGARLLTVVPAHPDGWMIMLYAREKGHGPRETA